MPAPSTPVLNFSGLLFQVSQVISGTMLYVCWANKENLWMIQTLKYIEMTAVNMLAVTNLAICINFALVVLVSEKQMSTADLGTI